MPPAAIEVVRAIYAAWNAAEWGFEYFHPEVEWEMKGALDQTGPGRGRDALFDYFRRFWAAWKPGARWELDELSPLGEEQVLGSVLLHAVGRSSGVDTAMQLYHLWTVEDGLAVRLISGDDRSGVLKAGGL